VLRAAAVKAADQLAAEQGNDVSTWNETVETGAFSAQGAGSAQALSPLPNRGSYAQVAEPKVARSEGSNATGGSVEAAAVGNSGAIGLVNTAGASGGAGAAGGLALAVVGLTVAGAVAARKRRA
jgi:hypothetical protein